MHKVAPKDIVGAIAGETGIPGKAIGSIRILDSYSFVEVPREYATEVYAVVKKQTIRNRRPGSARHQGSGHDLSAGSNFSFVLLSG